MKNQLIIGIITGLLIVFVFPSTLGQEDYTIQEGNKTQLFVFVNDTFALEDLNATVIPDTSRHEIGLRVNEGNYNSLIIGIVGIVGTVTSFLIGRHFQKKDTKFIIREMVKNMVEALNAYDRLKKVGAGKIAIREGKDPKIGADMVKVVNEFVKTFTMDAVLVYSEEKKLAMKKKFEKEILELGEGNEEKKAELEEKIRNLALDEDEKS